MAPVAVRIEAVGRCDHPINGQSHLREVVVIQGISRRRKYDAKRELWSECQAQGLEEDARGAGVKRIGPRHEDSVEAVTVGPRHQAVYEPHPEGVAS